MATESSLTAGSEVLHPVFERVDHRGTLIEILNSGRWESVLWGQMKAGKIMGNHYHTQTDVFFYLIDGQVEIVSHAVNTGKRTTDSLQPRQGLLLKPHTAHAICFKTESTFILLKSRRHDPQNDDAVSYRVVGATPPALDSV